VKTKVQNPFEVIGKIGRIESVYSPPPGTEFVKVRCYSKELKSDGHHKRMHTFKMICDEKVLYIFATRLKTEADE